MYNRKNISLLVLSVFVSILAIVPPPASADVPPAIALEDTDVPPANTK